MSVVALIPSSLAWNFLQIENLPFLKNRDLHLRILHQGDFNPSDLLKHSGKITMTRKEYNEIRKLKDEPFSKIADSPHNLKKVIVALPQGALKEKFDAEFGRISEADLLEKFGLETLRKFHQVHLLSDERMEKIEDAFKEKVRSDSDPLPQLIVKYGLPSLAKYFNEEELQNKCQAYKELVRTDPAPFSLLLKKYGLDECLGDLSIEQLKSKFDAETAGKTEQEILAEMDLSLFSGKAIPIIGYQRFLKLGTAKTEKEGVTREFVFRPNSVICRETQKFCEGANPRIESLITRYRKFNF